MNGLEMFLKENRKERECYFARVCNDIKDSDGNVVKWKFKPVTTAEEEEIRRDNYIVVEGKTKLNTDGYIASLICASVVYPNLYDANLQDSYNCKTPEKLLKAIVNVPGEYSALARLVQEKNGFKSLKDDVNTAKN